MDKYVYDGPVTEFGRVISNRWSSSTFATSEKKARSNLSFQFKKQFGKAPNVKVDLPAKITVIPQKEMIS